MQSGFTIDLHLAFELLALRNIVASYETTRMKINETSMILRWVSSQVLNTLKMCLQIFFSHCKYRLRVR
jgi:hypothetical protein